jgi:hypothetical protein
MMRPPRHLIDRFAAEHPIEAAMYAICGLVICAAGIYLAVR